MLARIGTLMKKARSEKGFTLIEVVVVVSIIGILAGIAVPRYSNYRQQAEQHADRLTAKVVQTALQLYYVEQGSYPLLEGFSGAKATDEGPQALFTELVNKKYLTEIPSFSKSAKVTYDNTKGTFTVTHDSLEPTSE